METARELMPLAKQMGAWRRSHKRLKLYVLGSVLALVDTMCSPFSAASRLHEREAALCKLRASHQTPDPQTVAKSQPDSSRGSRALAHQQYAS
ncbi:G0/G1 switch protein 2 [Sorex araneus]|uniref:G0/G1 switch protein 2 n=1 Tax=Sorex araneus TaxID=42254 RepID=UPI002433C18F|nr:G0/G1 switch protein 2 [Sorex araneus]